MSDPFAFSRQQAEALLEQLRKEPPWGSPTCEKVIEKARAGDFGPADELLSLVSERFAEMEQDDRDNLLVHLNRIIDSMQLAKVEKQLEQAHVRTTIAMLEGREAARQPATGQSGAAPKPESPLFSNGCEPFIGWKREQAGWTNQSVAQAKVTFRLAQEILGDQPVREYGREEAGKLYDTLLKLPQNHGRGEPKSVLEAIAEADREEAENGTSVARLQMKTVKRHFSALLQYWKWLKQRGQIDELIWSGFAFPGTKSSKTKRNPWSAEELSTLFASAWWAPEADRDSAKWWVPQIALYSGMRLEEICRLRPQDVQEIQGIPCFVICEHPDGWSPKTESGERLIPVHSFLIEQGFLGLLEKRRKTESPRIFAELKPSGPDGKLGMELGRKFGRLKTSLGIGPKTVFHSFRHTFRTVLESADLQERWIDAVMGHEDPRRSEGARTYAHGVAVERLLEVVDSVTIRLDFSQKIVKNRI